nr:MAG TPA: hypothetical protein [Caudoviricetes sp.]
MCQCLYHYLNYTPHGVSSQGVSSIFLNKKHLINT